VRGRLPDQQRAGRPGHHADRTYRPSLRGSGCGL
jgi:hypothetical protein